MRALPGLIREKAEASAASKEVGGRGAMGGDGKSCDAQHRCAPLASRGRGSPLPLHQIAQHTETTQSQFLGKKAQIPCEES